MSGLTGDQSALAAASCLPSSCFKLAPFWQLSEPGGLARRETQATGGSIDRNPACGAVLLPADVVVSDRAILLYRQL